jgi:hypothetical protein
MLMNLAKNLVSSKRIEPLKTEDMSGKPLTTIFYSDFQYCRVRYGFQQSRTIIKERSALAVRVRHPTYLRRRVF